MLFHNLISSFLLILCRDLGVHVDGFIANVAHSFVVGASKVRTTSFFLLSSAFVSVRCPLLREHLDVLLSLCFISAGEPHHRPES